MATEREQALDRAVQALARRDHSTVSLRTKLDRAGISTEAQDEAVGRLTRAGYLDDARFARDRAAHVAERGYGDEWIRADLETHGIPLETIAEALAGLEPERERARRQAIALGAGLRAAKTLQRRGFTEESLEPLLEGRLHTTPQQE